MKKTYEIREQITPENWREYEGYDVSDREDTEFTLLDICSGGGFWIFDGKHNRVIDRPLHAVREIDPRRETWDGQKLPDGVEPFSEHCLFLGRGGGDSVAYECAALKFARWMVRLDEAAKWDHTRWIGGKEECLYALDLTDPEAVAAFRRVMEEHGKGELAEQILGCYELPEGKRTPREVLEAWEPTCENGRRARAAALRQCDEDFCRNIAHPSLTVQQAISSFANWSETVEKDGYWRSVRKSFQDNTPIPDYPDLYAHTKDGEPITIPPEWADEWEIVPEGEKLPEGGCPYCFMCSEGWEGFPVGYLYTAPGEDGYAHLAGSTRQVRAYARRKVKREEAEVDDDEVFEGLQRAMLAFDTLTEEAKEALRIGRAVLKDAERTEPRVGDLCEFSDNKLDWTLGVLTKVSDGEPEPWRKNYHTAWKHCRRITALELVRRAMEGGEG